MTDEADDTTASEADDATTNEADDTEPDLFEGSVTQKAFLFGPDEQVLLTKSDDHWSIPGGKFEYGETMVGGIRRELREEVGVDARIGTPVGVSYGAWLTGDGTPLVTVFYRARTDEDTITLNEEHDEFAWVEPDTARDRLASRFGKQPARFLARAVTLDRIDRGADGAVPDGFTDTEPFTTRRDPFEGTDMHTDEWLAYVADAREHSLEALRAKYD